MKETGLAFRVLLVRVDKRPSSKRNKEAKKKKKKATSQQLKEKAKSCRRY